MGQTPSNPTTVARLWRQAVATAPNRAAAVHHPLTTQMLEMVVPHSTIVIHLHGVDYEVAQFGTPAYWQQIARAMAHQTPPIWTYALLDTAPLSGDTRAERNINHFIFAARAIFRFDSNWREALDVLIPPILRSTTAQAGEQLVNSATAQPPHTEPATSSTAQVNSEPVGVAQNVLPGTAVSDVVDVHPVSGAARPGIIVQQDGGIGPELMAQTGTAINLLTLVGTKIYSKVVTINTGVSQGTVIFEFPIHPWNGDLLNPHARKWAELHDRFYGTMDVHLCVVSAATIAGNLKAALIPAYYSGKISNAQANLDAFPHVEFACNVNGEGTIPCTPTARETALTGVYRDSPYSDFGKLVMIAATHIENAFAAPMGVQIKISLSLTPGSFYDLPRTFEGQTDGVATDASLDIGTASIHSRLVTDGIHSDGIPYSSEPESDTVVSGTMVGTNGLTEVIPFLVDPVGKHVALVSGANATHNGLSHSSPFTDQVEHPNSGAVYPVTGAFKRSPHYDDWLLPFNVPDRTIKLSNHVVATSRSTIGMYYSDFPDTVNEAIASSLDGSTNNDTEITIGTKLYRGSVDNTYVADYQIYYAQANCSDVPRPASGEPGLIGFPARFTGTSTYVKITGIPIANESSLQGPIAPPSFYNCKLVDDLVIVPSVAAATNGHTIPLVQPHVTAVKIAADACKAQGMRSVVTTFTSQEGVVVAQVIRNGDGMFIRREGIPRYSNCLYEVTDLTQSHTFSSVAYPLIILSSPVSFVDRSVSSISTAYYGGNEHSQALSSRALAAYGRGFKSSHTRRFPKTAAHAANLPTAYAIPSPTYQLQDRYAPETRNWGEEFTGAMSQLPTPDLDWSADNPMPMEPRTGWFGSSLLPRQTPVVNIPKSGKSTQPQASVAMAVGQAASSIGSSAISGLASIGGNLINSASSYNNINLQGQIAKSMQSRELALRSAMFEKQYAFQQSLINQRLLRGNNPVGRRF